MASPNGLTSSTTDSMLKNLFKFAMSGQWEEVVETYRRDPTACKARITKSGDTALHIAVNDGQEDTVQTLVDIISEQSKQSGTEVKEVLQIANKRGDTPLLLEYCQLCGCHCQRRWLQWWVVGGSQQPLSNVKVW